MDTILFYHSNCPDGFGSAYAFWKKFGNSIEFVPFGHRDVVPDVTGKNVYFADIAPTKEDLDRMLVQAKSVVVLDHHISRYESLKDYSCYKYFADHSGAMISWNYLFPNQEAPHIIKIIESRDLWKWNVPDDKELLTMLDSIEYDFEKWDEFEKNLHISSQYQRAVISGEAILQYSKSVIARIIKGKFDINILGHTVPCVNTPFFKSETLNILAEDSLFAAGYHFDGENYIFSLRSKGFDVAELASRFPGGGGHTLASGFQIKSLSSLSGE